MEQFEKILLKYNCLKRVNKGLINIEEIETFASFGLPEDYKSFIQGYQGFEKDIGQEYVRLWDIDELKKFNHEYGIMDYLSNTLAIGGNGGGEFIALEYISKENYRIVLSPFIDLDEQHHMEIGTSFTDFLVRLENGQKWFNE